MIEWSRRGKRFNGNFEDALGRDCLIFTLLGCLCLGETGNEIDLTRKQAGELGKVLTRFSETGELGGDE